MDSVTCTQDVLVLRDYELLGLIAEGSMASVYRGRRRQDAHPVAIKVPHRSVARNKVLLEPIMAVEVVTPAEYLGDVMGDLSSRRGKIGGMTQRAAAQVITATVPLSEMFGYSTTLRSMSQGRAVYTMQFSHYEEVPKAKADEIINKVKG